MMQMGTSYRTRRAPPRSPGPSQQPESNREADRGCAGRLAWREGGFGPMPRFEVASGKWSLFGPPATELRDFGLNVVMKRRMCGVFSSLRVYIMSNYRMWGAQWHPAYTSGP